MTCYISLIPENVAQPVCFCRPETVRSELKGDLFTYFNTNFPHLVLETYKVVKGFPGKQALLSCATKQTKV